MGVTLGEWLRTNREAAGLSVRGLSRLTGVRPGTIIAIERGETPKPARDRKTVALLAAHVGGDVQEALIAAGFRVENDLPPAVARLAWRIARLSEHERERVEELVEEMLARTEPD